MSKLLLTVLILWFCFELGTVIEAGDECFNRNSCKDIGEALEMNQ